MISILPIGLKGFVLFIIKYFFLLGFLDVKIGFIYCFLNSLEQYQLKNFYYLIGLPQAIYPLIGALD